MSIFSTALSGALIGCCMFSAGTTYLASCAKFYNQVNESITAAYGESHMIKQTCLESSMTDDDNNSCLQSAGWYKANDRYQFQQRKTEKVPYKLGRVVEFIM